ncbi:zinc finger protein 395a [Ictalurus furcatus]|uniref:zinc finger protein 395a n=1 Tax=Ictalurus furcatus TaxID=66913 RepID=UPI00235090B4|nr:zinc finger protein 395a [Ictalurus furcatus]XP_053488315.1 zinc finger protein 395a [Ictalurus furcatus]XP_053488317.1 zinc finger protein 395a [Ictalurus furcatus]
MEKVLTATVLPRSRLGKRSPLGALVCNSSAEGLVDVGGHGDTDGVPVISGIGAGVHGVHRVKLHPGQRVYVHCGGQERAGAVEQHNHVDNEVSIFIQQLNQRVHRKLEDVWLSPSGVLAHPVSLSIDVPKRSVESADMDEIMAAMVLTSLSCSPMIQSPVHGEPAPVSNGTDSTGSEMSDGGYWSCDHGNSSPAPSPPDAEADRTPPVDDGLDMEMDQVLFDEPAPRKRKNSVKVAYRCLWPNCGKILTTIVGMKRHIRTLHLGRQSEQERCQREEDFYYTEIYQDAEQPAAPAGSGSPSSPSHRRSSPPTPEPLQPSPLSQSAPSSFWQVHSEHSYQAPPPVGLTPCKAVCVPVLPRWAPLVTPHQNKQAAPFRRRSVSVGEQWLQSHSAPSRPPHLASVSPPRSHCASRRVRGEAKKCRKVYGIEHRDQWCTACRWKKACQRFLD